MERRPGSGRGNDLNRNNLFGEPCEKHMSSSGHLSIDMMMMMNLKNSEIPDIVNSKFCVFMKLS